MHEHDAGQPRVAVVQDGARRHYVVPAALQRAGMLERVFVEWYTSRGSVESAIAAVAGWFKPELGRKLSGRRHPDLDENRIFHNPSLTLRQRLNRKKFASAESYYAWVAKQAGQWIIRRGFGEADALYGYIRNVDPGVFQECRRRGIKTIGDQMIAPAAIEIAEAKTQQQRWPGWESANRKIDEAALVGCETESWAALDHLTCGSQYVADGLMRQGIDADRITVIPYAPSGANLPFVPRENCSGPMTVGFVGSVNLRKGTPYFFQAARRFDPTQVRFVMVGPVQIEKSVLAREKDKVEIIGPAPRSDIFNWLTKFDVMLFPSTCEGCAGSVLEAMETGLPVIATPNSGAIIRDGVDGYLRSYDDIDGFVNLINQLREDPAQRQSIGLAARKSVEQLDMTWFTGRLAEMIRKVCGPDRSSNCNPG